jgi:hypothetical protein
LLVGTAALGATPVLDMAVPRIGFFLNRHPVGGPCWIALRHLP